MAIPASITRISALRRGPIARGALASIAIRVATLALGFAQAILAARLLGPQGYGVVAVAMSVAAIAGTLTMLGLGPLAVREVARLSVRAEWGRLRGFLRFSTRSVLAASALAAAVIVALALATPLFGPSFRGAVALAAPLAPLLALLAVFRGQCQGFGRVVAAQAPGELLRPALMVAALGLLFAMAGAAAPRAYIILAIGAALAGTAAAALTQWRIVATMVPAAPPMMAPREWSGAATPFLALAIAGILQGEVNTLLLGWLVGPTEAGLFQPLARLAPVMLIGMQAVSMRYGPRVSELWAQGDTAQLIRVTRMVTVTTTLFAAATCAAILLLAPWILGIFGKAFTANAAALGWIAAAQMFSVACGPAGLLLTMSGHPSRALAGHLAGLSVNVALGLWLIPQHGAHGAAQAMAGGTVVLNLVMLVGVRRHLGFDPSLAGLLQLFRQSGH
jgi:O-antigen/teichoic acid export membrane protein